MKNKLSPTFSPSATWKKNWVQFYTNCHLQLGGNFVAVGEILDIPPSATHFPPNATQIHGIWWKLVANLGKGMMTKSKNYCNQSVFLYLFLYYKCRYCANFRRVKIPWCNIKIPWNSDQNPLGSLLEIWYVCRCSY